MVVCGRLQTFIKPAGGAEKNFSYLITSIKPVMLLEESKTSHAAHRAALAIRFLYADLLTSEPDTALTRSQPRAVSRSRTLALVVVSIQLEDGEK